MPASSLVQTYAQTNLAAGFGCHNLPKDTQLYDIFEIASQPNQCFFRRIFGFVLVDLYPKGHHGLNLCRHPERRYRIMTLGRQWHSIFQTYQRVCRELKLSEPLQPSILFLVTNHSLWERTRREAWHMALTTLCQTSDFHHATIEKNEEIKDILGNIKGRIQFVKPSIYATTNSLVRSYTTAKPKQMSADKATLQPAAGSVGYTPQTHSLTAEAFALLLLLSFSISSGGSLHTGLLKSAGSMRHRWTCNCYPREDPSSFVDLVPEVAKLLSTQPYLDLAFKELYAAGSASQVSDETPSVTITATGNKLLAGKVEKLSKADVALWKCQALIVACRSVPFKYLGPANTVEERTSLKSYLQHTLEALRVHDRGFENLSSSTRVEVALCLVEASRFPGMAWKRSILAWAKEVMGHNYDFHVESGILQRETVIQRLEGDVLKARHTINRLLSHNDSALSRCEWKEHHNAATGHAFVEQALNFFQEEQLATANTILNSWKPLSDPPSPAEYTVVFRGELLRAKILRYQGEFSQALASIQRCREIVLQHHPKTIMLKDDLASLACEHADTLRELNRLQEAEELLEKALSRCHLGVSDFQVLSLCHAEVLFAQCRLDEAKAVCDKVCDKHSTAVPFAKMARLRLCITRAKISHLQAEWNDALSWWTEALTTIAKFPPTSGHATLAIHDSIGDVLQHQKANLGMNEETRARGIAELKKLVTESEAIYWIAGLRHWCAYLNKPVSLVSM